MKKLRSLLLVLAASLVMTGCDFDVYKLPLPGGTDTGDNPITMHAKFHDVLDLVPKSTVKVNDVSVGQVTDIDLDGYVADVTLRAARRHQAARQRRSPRCARPACSARSSSR